MIWVNPLKLDPAPVLSFILFLLLSYEIYTLLQACTSNNCRNGCPSDLFYFSFSLLQFLRRRLTLFTPSLPTSGQVYRTAMSHCYEAKAMGAELRRKCKPNSLPVLQKMHVKLGDTVRVISGRETGKIGEIAKIFKHNSSVVVKEVNLKAKHMKSREEGEPGQIVKIEAPIHCSNVMVYLKEESVASRIGHKILEDGKRVRYLIKTGEIIDSAEEWKRVVKEREKSTEEVVAA